MTQNIKYNLIYKFIAVFFPFIVSLYIARVLGAVCVGKLAVALNRTSYFVSLASLGMLNYGIREIARTKSDINKEKKVVKELLTINIISSFLAIILFWLYLMIRRAYDFRMYALYSSLILGNMINVEWYFFGNEKYKYIAMRSLVVKVITTILIFLLVKEQGDYLKYVAFYCLGIIGNYLFNICYMLQDIGIYRGKLSIKTHIKPIMVLFLSSLSVDLFSRIDISMLSYWEDSYSIACYSYSVKLVKMVAVVFFSFTSIVLPRISSSDGEKTRNIVIGLIYKLVFILGAGTMIVIICGSNNVVHLLWGKEYDEAIPIMKFLSPIVFICPIGNLFGVQLLTALDEEKKLLYSNFIGIIINVLLNMIFIPRYGTIGAAIASIMCETSVAIVQFLFVRKKIELRTSSMYYVKVCVALMALFCVEKKLVTWFRTDLITIFMSILVGALVYLGLLFFMGIKREVVQDESQ